MSETKSFLNLAYNFLRRRNRMVASRTNFTTSTMSETKSFLDLAAELRVEIYDAIVNVDIDNTWMKASPCQTDHPGHQYIAPWCSMMLVCRQIRSELQEHMGKELAAKGSKYNTWTLRFRDDYGAKLPVQMRLPCCPWRLRKVEILMPPLEGIFHSRRAPTTIDHLLSVLVQFGPRLNLDVELAKPLCFGELIIAFPKPIPTTGSSIQYHLEESVVSAFRRLQLQRGRSDAEHPLIGAFEKVTLVTRMYEQSWSMTMEEID